MASTHVGKGPSFTRALWKPGNEEPAWSCGSCLSVLEPVGDSVIQGPGLAGFCCKLGGKPLFILSLWGFLVFSNSDLTYCTLIFLSPSFCLTLFPYYFHSFLPLSVLFFPFPHSLPHSFSPFFNTCPLAFPFFITSLSPLDVPYLPVSSLSPIPQPGWFLSQPSTFFQHLDHGCTKEKDFIIVLTI